MTRTFFCALLALTSGNTFACRCLQASLAEQFAKADVVFVGSTNSSPLIAGKAGETISFQVSRPLKGAPVAGATIAVDPLFESDCAAGFVEHVQLLVFAYSQPGHPAVVNACSTRFAAPIFIEGQEMRPDEVSKFLESLPSDKKNAS